MKTLVCSSILAAAGAWTFSAQPDATLQPLFLNNGSWIGADIATSVPLSADGTRILWLFGDSMLGSMDANGTRNIDAMPRNSVGLVHVAQPGGQPVGGLVHAWRNDSSQPVHVGFFSPPNASTWYWPTGGAYHNGTTFVVAYETAPGPPGLFAFQTVGMHILQLAEADVQSEDPLQWPVPTPCILPNINNSFTIGNAVAVDEAAGVMWLLGGTGNPQQAIMAQWPLPAVHACDTSQIQYWANNAGGGAPSWQPWSPSIQPVQLFEFVPSETTLQWHPYLQQWFIVVANTFLSGSVMLSTAPTVTGPWSPLRPVYDIPRSYLTGDGFCYAGKAHPELSPPATPGQGDLLFTYNCNTPNLTSLANRPDMYFPRPVRVTITA